jgi:hypothetical protein
MSGNNNTENCPYRTESKMYGSNENPNATARELHIVLGATGQPPAVKTAANSQEERFLRTPKLHDGSFSAGLTL